MALSEREAADLADLLPDALSCDDARERLLCVAELLATLTDTQHQLSNADIRAVLRARFGEGCAPSENTIAADLHAIASSGCLGLSLHTTPKGTWCERTRLTPTKVRMLLNAVQASRFLTVAQSNELQEDLFGLVSRHQEDDLVGEVHVEQRVRKDYQQVFDAIDVIAHALRENRKIEFTYTYTGFDGKPHPLASDQGELVRHETPIALFFTGGEYTVETYAATPWRHGLHRVMSRVDRMVGVRVSNEPADRCREVYDARRSARRRVSEDVISMPGPVRWIFLRVRGDMTNVFYDQFGYVTKFAEFDGMPGDPSRTGLTLVRAPQSLVFFRWLSAAGAGITVVRPPEELTLRSGPWRRQLEGISREELVQDYEEMVSAFLAYLRRAEAPYL